MACPCCNPDPCTSAGACVIDTALYYRHAVSISTPELSYLRIAQNDPFLTCNAPLSIQPATGGFEFISSLWYGDPGYMVYPFPLGPLQVRNPVGWRSSTIYTTASPGNAGRTPTPIGTGIRDFYFSIYATKLFNQRMCEANIVGSFSLLLTPGTGVLTNTDAIYGTVYDGAVNPQCAETSGASWRVAVYFTALPRKLSLSAYNCVSGTFDLYHLDLAATGGILPPTANRSFIPNGPKIGTITIGEPT